MDKEPTKRDWSWLKAQMPGVAKQIAEKRALWGNAHVNECWRRSVEHHEPGWFFAREGALAVGTPFDQAEAANFAALHVTSTQALVLIRPPEVSNGQAA